MKWIKVEDSLPSTYDWVVAGHEDPDYPDGFLVWTIARHDGEKWQMLTTKHGEPEEAIGAWRTDMTAMVYGDKITHWIEIGWADVNEKENPDK